MGHDDLTAAQIRTYVGRAGGTRAVAAALAVPVADVVRWSRDGISGHDEHTMALVELGFHCKRRGPPQRCVILLEGELDRFIKVLGGLKETASWLGVSVRTLRRYRTGKVNLPEQVADDVREVLCPK